MRISIKHPTFHQILIIGSLITIFCACDTKESSLPPPPPPPPKVVCPEIKRYCEPDDSCDYQYIKADFYSKNNGHIYQRKTAFDGGCCEFKIFYDSTLGYWESKQELKNVIDLDSYVYVDSSGYTKDKKHVYWMTINSDGGRLNIIEDADSKTFRRIAVPSADKLSFDYRWGIDKKSVYFKGNRLEGLSVKNFQFLRLDTSDMRPDYIKDNKFVFYEYNKIEKADAKTFRLVEHKRDLDYDAVDKYRKYRRSEPVE